jgi:hypothetical protein
LDNSSRVAHTLLSVYASSTSGKLISVRSQPKKLAKKTRNYGLALQGWAQFALRCGF